MLRSYRNLPPIVTGYPLDDVWSVVVPIARTNLITNPSFETNTTLWTAIGGGSIARSTLQQYHGAYSLQVSVSAAVTDGAYYDTVTLTSGTTYAYSCKVRGLAGLKYSIGINNTAGNVALATTTFTATGRWQWISGYYKETSTTGRRFIAQKAGTNASTSPFYIDGAQVEAIVAGELVSTYIDGDQLGLVPNQSPAVYFWNGTPHASTSTRSGLTRAGGMVVPFKKYGFLLTAMVGLGLAAPQNVATDYARIDGGFDNYTRKPSRQFTLTGRFQGRTYRELRSNRSALAQLFDRDLIGQDQQLTLFRHVEDGYGRILTSETRHTAKYESGFGGNTDNQAAETVPLTFTSYMPLIAGDGESGSALTAQLSISNANGILQRSAAGIWSAMGTGMSGGAPTYIYTIARGLDGTIYAGGDFTDAGGSGADYIAQWNGSAWAVLGSTTAINGIVFATAVGPDGALYAGGNFTNAGGVAAADGIAKWNGSAWTALGTGTNAGGIVYSLAFDSAGNLYAGGDFTLMGGVANTVRIAKWNGSAWTALGTGAANNTVLSLATAGTTIYAGGDFTNMGGVAAADGIAKWNGTVWAGMGTGIPSDNVAALSVGPNNLLYLGGAFPSINGQTIPYIATWNGVSYGSVGTLDSGVRSLAVEPNGTVHIGGTFTIVNGVTYPDSFARLSGGLLTPENVDLPSTATVGALLAPTDGTLYVGFNTTGSATAAANTTVTNPGTARSYPTIIIKGPSSGTGRIYQITNYSNNRSIYLNLTLNVGETAKLVFQPDNLSFTSDFQGNIAGSILAGSNTADFFLQPGANLMSFFSGSSTVTVTLYYRPNYTSLDDVP